MSSFNKVLFLGVAIALGSCKEDAELPDNLVTFESDQLGISEDEDELVVTIKLSRQATSEAEISVQLAPEGLTYGTDFTTFPEATSNVLTLPVIPGSTEASFTIIKSENVLFDGDEEILFTLLVTEGNLVVGDESELTVTFAELIALSGDMEISGGGALYPNKVFIDLSGNRQTSIARTQWDLAFTSGSGFRVVLNSSNGMLARMLDKTDLNAVTAADTVGWGAQLSLPAIFTAVTTLNPVPDWVAQAVTWMDDPSGDLTKTAIPEISSTVSENKVYIINRGSGPGSPAPQLNWKKVRIVRNGNGYTLQHADISAATFSEIQITKNTDYAFQYVSFTSGNITVEPPVGRWDFAWTGFTNTTNFGTGLIPYYFQDVILQNMTGVQAVQVLTSTKTYEAFVEADLSTLDFSNQNQLKIGTNWRTGGGPSGPPSIRTDRFYVVRDGSGNYYKVRFTALTTGGERGKPKFEFALVKKAS
jgi:hypothetical protein